MSSVPMRCGDGKLCGDGGAEYPCVRRFRHRRLIAFLWIYGFEATIESMLGESDAICSPRRLQQLVQRQQWRDAHSYLCRFLPPVGTERLSVEAHVLDRFLGVHTVLASIVAGVKDDPVYSQYLSHDRTVSYGAIRIRSIILSILYARQLVRTSIDWECVRYKAADIIYDLVYRTPELKDLILMPGSRMKPHNVLPIGFGFRGRRHLKKRTRRPRASALAKVYIGRQRSLPAISDPSQESYDELTVSKALDWVADIVDECLKAGRRPESHPVRPLQTSGMEGAFVAPVSQNILGTLRDPAKTLRMTSVANGGQPASLLTPGAPNLVTMFNAPASLNLVGFLTSTAKNSELSLMKNNAGAPVAPAVLTTNFASHAESSDINKNSDQVACNVGDSAHQGFSPRENSREDITTTCGEASPMLAIQT